MLRMTWFTLCMPLSHMETSSLDSLSLVLGVAVVSSSIGFASDSPTTDACGGLGLESPCVPWL